MTEQPILQARELRKAYRGPAGDIPVLTGLSLDLAPGEFASIQGASGCGKSTLLLILGGLLRPDAGSVAVGHDSLTDAGPGRQAKIRAQRIGFVFQQFHLVPYLSVAENILAGALTLEDKPDPARAAELMRRFDLAARAEHLPGSLSVGEQQRTALARALYHRPRLLLADEPTGNLDPANANVVLDAFREFADDGGAVLLVTHHPEAAAKAPRQLDLHAGQLRPRGQA